MGWPVVTVASGGMPVVDVTATTGRGTPVTEATNGFGRAVTKVASGGMAVAYETLVVWPPPASAFATLDLATVTNVALSNGNLTATHTNTTQQSGARNVVYQTTGKFYFEGTMVTTNGAGDCVGLVTSAGTYSDMHNGANCVITIKSSGNIFSNGANAGKALGAITAGNIIGIAVDLGARKAWLRKSGGNWNGLAIGSEDPAAGLGGVTLYPTVSFAPAVLFTGTGSAANDATTMNFGATAYANAAPSGFLNWPVS